MARDGGVVPEGGILDHRFARSHGVEEDAQMLSRLVITFRRTEFGGFSDLDRKSVV